MQPVLWHRWYCRKSGWSLWDMDCVASLSGTLSSYDFRLEMSNWNFRKTAINGGEYRNKGQLKTILDALIARLKKIQGLTTTQKGREVIHVRISHFRRIPGKCPGGERCNRMRLHTVHASGLLELSREHMALFAPGTQFITCDYIENREREFEPRFEQSEVPTTRRERRPMRNQQSKAPTIQKYKNVRNSNLNWIWCTVVVIEKKKFSVLIEKETHLWERNIS